MINDINETFQTYKTSYKVYEKQKAKGNSLELSAFYILAILYSSRTKLEKMKKHIKFMQN